MHAKSHLFLGRYLADQYFRQQPRHHIQAFLLGCIQPDKNPTTYLKGSLRYQWLRGHNYPNSCRYISRLCARLERKPKMDILGYYALGKLIHYTADAFTYAHNSAFSQNLRQHKAYEQALQRYFLQQFDTISPMKLHSAGSAIQTIHQLHQSYRAGNMNIHTDSRYILTACHILCSILPK